jgi:BirA family biotin operon repressor/biotin-[acetyl-CoA-carboxylase] ligase
LTTREAVLRALLERGGFVSGEELARRLGLTRAAVAKTVGRLRAAGYEIESIPHRGHRLVRPSSLLVPGEVLEGLETRELGRSIHFDRVVPSTQQLARTLAEDGAPHGTMVIAGGEQ